jgi:hypothetical protein
MNRTFRWVRRHPIWTGLAGTILFFATIPTQQFYPSCYKLPTNAWYDAEEIREKMSDDYREALKYHLYRNEVYFWDIGGEIYIRWVPFFYAGYRSSQGEALSNSDGHAVFSLIEPLAFHLIMGEELNGRIYLPPIFTPKLRAKMKDSFDFRRCDVMKPIVLDRYPAE